MALQGAMSYLSHAFPETTSSGEVMLDERIRAGEQAPWYRNIAIASGLMAVPVLIGLAGWDMHSARFTADTPVASQAKLLNKPLAKVPATRQPTAETESLDHARLRLTPL